MKRLIGPFFYADQQFQKPGLYFCRNGNRRIVPLPQAPEPMQLIEFAEQTIVIAKDQPQYRPLPAYRFAGDPEGRIVCCWKIHWSERLKLIVTGKIWHQILTFNQPLQPQLLTVEKPEMPNA